MEATNFTYLTYLVECSYGLGKKPPAELPAAAVWILKGLNVGSTTNAPLDDDGDGCVFLISLFGIFKVVGKLLFGGK